MNQECIIKLATVESRSEHCGRLFHPFYQFRQLQIVHVLANNLYLVSMEIKHELRTGSLVKHCATLFIVWYRAVVGYDHYDPKTFAV
jgi:hypothetical protein